MSCAVVRSNAVYVKRVESEEGDRESHGSLWRRHLQVASFKDSREPGVVVVSYRANMLLLQVIRWITISLPS